MTRYSDKIIQSYENGHINDYMAKRLLSTKDSGITDEVYGVMEQDAKDASEFGVNSDKDYHIYFYTCHFCRDILKDTFKVQLNPEQMHNLHKYIVSHKDKGYKFDDLTDYRLLIHDWLNNKMDKKAHPNVAGKGDRAPYADLDKWIFTIKNIYIAINDNKIDRHDAIEAFTKDWDEDEKFRFINWMKYYESGITENYSVKTANLKKESVDILLPQTWISRENDSKDGMYMSTNKADDDKISETRKEKELKKARLFKVKMKSRLHSLKSLVDKYNDILPKQNLDHIYEEIHKLEKGISKLDVYASMQSCIIRSANIIRKYGFSEGADYLQKFADPAVDKTVMNALPEPESLEPNLTGQSKFNVTTIIQRLEAVSKVLKSRDMIRELASIDILLNELGMASFFPELTDSQSKLIESFGYASNKVEQIIAKLRGSGTSKAPKDTASGPIAPDKIAPTIPSPIPPAPPIQKPIDTGEILSKPVEEVKREIPKPGK